MFDNIHALQMKSFAVGPSFTQRYHGITMNKLGDWPHIIALLMKSLAVGPSFTQRYNGFTMNKLGDWPLYGHYQ